MANRTWKRELDAVNSAQEHARNVRELTRDLPINARYSVDIADNPLASGGHKIAVVRSLRDDPLAGMLSRSQIDQAQYMAGRKWQEYAEMCEIGGVQAVDTTKEPVDGGGGFRDPITEKQVEAVKKLAAADVRLGAAGARLVVEILAWRVSIRQAAESRGRFTKYGWEKTGREFRGHLEDLAILWGYAQRKATA